MVLVGHSMGGLVAELQTLDSRDDFWKVISSQPLEAIKASDAARRYLVDTYFFRPNPAVRRVVTIGTPFHGSQMANSAVRWLGNKLIKLPEMTFDDARQLHKDNPDLLREPGNLIDIRTSIDALAPDSPILPVMAEARRAPWVRYHNIVGRVPDKSFIGRVVGGSDGLVSCESCAPGEGQLGDRGQRRSYRADAAPAERAGSAPHPAGAPGRRRRAAAGPLGAAPVHGLGPRPRWGRLACDAARRDAAPAATPPGTNVPGMYAPAAMMPSGSLNQAPGAAATPLP